MQHGSLDLFGNEHPAPASKAKAIALDLFSAAAESKAMESGRPVSQERNRILVPKAEPWTAPLCSIHGTPLLLEHSDKRILSCPRCA